MTLSCYGCRHYLWTCMLLVWTVVSRCSHLSHRSVTGVLVEAAMSMSTIPTPRQAHAYEPPIWTRNVLENIPPNGRLHLANLPTPLYKLESFTTKKNGILQSLKDEYGISLFVKRDDMTGGVELGGNKLRKLEFLMADALAKGYNAVVTIGGIQSNHCRATASVARMMGLEPHLILRTNSNNKSGKSTSSSSSSNTSKSKSNDDIGLTGNLLMDRMVGSHIYTCTPGEYGRIGSDALVERLCSHLRQQTTSNDDNNNEDNNECCKPYGIPVGGSNGIGSWGYVNAVEEVMGQWTAMRDSLGSFLSLDHVVFACGSGGTAAGIGLGMALARPHKPHVHAMGVCDTPSYFEHHVSQIITDMGLVLPSYLSTQEFISQHMDFHQGKGLGYATSTPEELEFCTQFAMETGIVLDPVYSGKALYQFITHVLPNHEDPESFKNTNVLFWHTGGSLGLYDKADDLLSTLQTNSPVQRLNVYDTNNNDDDDADDKGSISI